MDPIISFLCMYSPFVLFYTLISSAQINMHSILPLKKDSQGKRLRFILTLEWFI